MTAKIIKVQKQPSRFGGDFFFVFLKTADGKSAKTCIYPNYGNAKRWLPVITTFPPSDGHEVWLDGLNMKGSLVDADSQFVLR